MEKNRRSRKVQIQALLKSAAVAALLMNSGILHGQTAGPLVPKDIILICWDGLDRSVLRELLDKQKLPNLKSLIDEGSLQDIEVAGHVTVTKPSHAEMLTGLDTATTGVYSNAVYRPIPEGCTIFERLQSHFGGPQAIRTIFLAGKTAHVGGRSPEEIKQAMERQQKQRQKLAAVARRGQRANPPSPRIAAGADDTLFSREGEPFYLTRKHLDVFDAIQREASAAGLLCLKYLDQYKADRFFAFLHFSDPDHAGHRSGIDSQEYRQAAIEDDGWLGKIKEWLQRENLSDKTLLYVTTDHGFDEHGSSHADAPHAWLATNDKKVTRGGIIADIPATILERYGVDVKSLEPKLIGIPLEGEAPQRSLARPPIPVAKLLASLPSAEELFALLDLNRDGKITPDEFPRPRLFQRLDLNRDKTITREEAEKVLSKRAKKSPAYPLFLLPNEVARLNAPVRPEESGHFDSPASPFGHV